MTPSRAWYARKIAEAFHRIWLLEHKEALPVWQDEIEISRVSSDRSDTMTSPANAEALPATGSGS